MLAAAEICYRRRQLENGDIHPDEPLFVLRGSDPLAAEIVRKWIVAADRAGRVSEDRLTEAAGLSDLMDKWPNRDPRAPEASR